MWAAQPEIREVDDLGDGPAYPVLTGDYTGEQARWASTPMEVGRPLARPTPIFTKLDPALGETGPEWAPIAGSDEPAAAWPARARRRTAGEAAAAPAGAVADATVDAHTHLDACGATTPELLAAAWTGPPRWGWTRAVTVADDLASARWVVDAATWDDRVVAAVALHPTRTAAVTDRRDLAEIERLAAQPRVVAVGETGLDYYWDFSPPEAQQRAFRWHIGLAKRLGKPLMIHDREAHADILRILREEGAPPVVVFHCFSGDAGMARDASTRGTCSRSPGRSRSRTRPTCARPPRSCPTTSSSSRPTPPSSPRTRTAAGPTSRSVYRGRCGRSPPSAACPTSGSHHALGVTPSGCFGSVSCRPARRLVHRAQRTHVRRSGPAAQRSRCVTARSCHPHPVTVP